MLHILFFSLKYYVIVLDARSRSITDAYMHNIIITIVPRHTLYTLQISGFWSVYVEILDGWDRSFHYLHVYVSRTHGLHNCTVIGVDLNKFRRL